MADWLLRFDTEAGRNGEKVFQILKEASEQNKQIYSIPFNANDISKHHFRDATIGDIVYFWLGGSSLRYSDLNGIYDKAMLTEIDTNTFTYTFKSTDINFRKSIFNKAIPPISSKELKAKVKRKENLISPDEKDFIEGQFTLLSVNFDHPEKTLSKPIQRMVEDSKRLSDLGGNSLISLKNLRDSIAAAAAIPVLPNFGVLKPYLDIQNSINSAANSIKSSMDTASKINPNNLIPNTPSQGILGPGTKFIDTTNSLLPSTKQGPQSSKVKLTGILSNVLAKLDRVASNPRLKEKGYQSTAGVKVLRGFAPYSHLEGFHTTDKDYQRAIIDEHKTSLVRFMESDNNFIPEIIYAFRAEDENPHLEQVEVRGSDTQKGTIENLDVYHFTPPDGAELYCIDGNHRFKAIEELAQKGQELLIPFCIIFVADKADTEQFIFNEPSYFFNLNGRSEPLLYEQTFKYLADSLLGKRGIEKQLSCYKFFEILNAVGSIPVFEDKIGSDDSKLGELLFQVYKKYEDEIEANPKFVENFKTTLSKICSDPKFENSYIMGSCPDILPALCLYLYRSDGENSTDTKDKLWERCEWLERRRLTAKHFDSIEKMELQFEEHMKTKVINIFMAMPFEPSEIVDNMNRWKNEELLPQLKKKFDNCEVTFPEIMREKAEAREMWNDIINKIYTADIVICDITGSNINVIYEMGIAYGKEKKILAIIKDQTNGFKVPFDISQFSHIKYIDVEKREFKDDLTGKISNIIKNLIETRGN